MLDEDGRQVPEKDQRWPICMQFGPEQPVRCANHIQTNESTDMNHRNKTPPGNPSRMHSRATSVMAEGAAGYWLAEMPDADRAKTYTPRQIESAMAMPMTQLAAVLTAYGFTHFTRRTPRGTPRTYWAGPDAGDPKRPTGRPPHEDSTHAVFEATLFRGTPARVRPIQEGVDFDCRTKPGDVMRITYDFYAHSFEGWADDPGGRLYCLAANDWAAVILGHHGGNDRRTRCRNMAVTYAFVMGKRYIPGMESLARTLPEPLQPAFRAEWEQCQNSMMRNLDQAHALNTDGERPYELENWRVDFIDHWKWIADQMDKSTDPRAAAFADQVRAMANHHDAGPRYEAPLKKRR